MPRIKMAPDLGSGHQKEYLTFARISFQVLQESQALAECLGTQGKGRGFGHVITIRFAKFSQAFRFFNYQYKKKTCCHGPACCQQGLKSANEEGDAQGNQYKTQVLRMSHAGINTRSNQDIRPDTLVFWCVAQPLEGLARQYMHH